MTATLLNKALQTFEDPEAAAFLSKPQSFRYVAPFVARELSLRQAADELQVGMTALHYWVQKMLRLGILQVSREEKRKGRPIRFYRTVADQLFVPFAATPADTLEDLFYQRESADLRTLVRGIAQVRRASGPTWGTLLAREPSGLLKSNFTVLEAEQPRQNSPVLSGWITLHLTPQQALQVKERMNALLAELAEMGEEGEGDSHIVHLGIAPLD